MSTKIYRWTNPHHKATQTAYAFDAKNGKRHIRVIKGKGGVGEKVARSLIEHDLSFYESNGWA